MSIPIEQLRTDLADAARLGDIIAGILARTWEKEKAPASMLAMVEHTYRSFVDIVIERSESPIETMLFNSLLVGCAMFDPMSIMVRRVEGDALEYVSGMLEAHAATRYIQQKSARDPQKRSVDDYINWLVAEQGMSAKEADDWKAQDIGAALYGDAFQIIPQATVKLPGAKKAMRLDALVYVPNRPSLRVAVECDGYEWHSGKTAFTNDRSRDRLLKRAGIDVIRFSGSEIYTDPATASADLYQQLDALRSRAPRPRRWGAVAGVKQPPKKSPKSPPEDRG